MKNTSQNDKLVRSGTCASSWPYFFHALPAVRVRSTSPKIVKNTLTMPELFSGVNKKLT